MIQRIQSLYLALAAIISIVVVFLTIGTMYTDLYVLNYSCWTVKMACPGGEPVLYTYYVGALLVISAIISVVTIFLFKKRDTQRLLNSVNMIVYLVALIMMLYVYPNVIFVKKEFIASAEELNFNYWILISLLPAVCLYLANRAIRKDEELIKAADRLR